MVATTGLEMFTIIDALAESHSLVQTFGQRALHMTTAVHQLPTLGCTTLLQSQEQRLAALHSWRQPDIHASMPHPPIQRHHVHHQPPTHACSHRSMRPPKIHSFSSAAHIVLQYLASGVAALVMPSPPLCSTSHLKVVRSRHMRWPTHTCLPRVAPANVIDQNTMRYTSCCAMCVYAMDGM